MTVEVGHADRTSGRADWQLLESIGRLARLATGEFTQDDLLRHLCEAATEALDVDGAGVMAFNLGLTRFVGASRRSLEPIERLQETLQSGPCHDAMESRMPVAASTVLAIAESWPEFAVEAIRAGVQSVLAVPLLSPGRCWGSLDLYWQRPHRHSARELAGAQLLADVVVSYLTMATDRIRHQAAQEQLANRILHDQLTGLPNRGLIHELIYHALAASERHSTSVAVLFIDLDLFKAVNDSHGHLVGDLVLQEVARRLNGAIRVEDSVGRLSGDEFVVICESLPATAAMMGVVATRLAERLGAVIAEPMVFGDITVTLTASIGVAVTDGRPSAADLIHHADTAMYEVKAAGGSGFVIREALSDADLVDRRSLERRLFEALERGEFEVHYQPVFDRQGEMAAVEALLRWRHPTEGMIPADEFIAVAEATGAVVPIGHWVIRESLRQLTVWRDTHPGTAPALVFCNLSPRELIAPDLPDVVAAALAEHGLAPRHLGLEILENDLAAPRLSPAVRSLQEAGHPLAIDDFGTGYSSLARLVEIPVTHIKIDRSLVAGLPGDVRSQTLIRAVMTIADSLDVEVISEGIETAEQAAYLHGVGCTFFQGYHLGRPMSADAIAELLGGPATELSAAPGGTSTPV